MELNLSPVFYHQVSSVSPNTMKILPSTSQRGAQRIAIGDQNGVLTVFGMKRGDSQIVFKSLPGPPIFSVQLNGPTGGVFDKIFVASGSEVKAFTKKGKQFLKFDTNLTEPIRSMWVKGSHLFTAGSYVYNHYVDCQDTDYYLSCDTINAVLNISTNDTDEVLPVLACQDCALRVLKGSNLLYELEVAGPPTALAIDPGNGDDKSVGILYGTLDGRLGLVKLHRDAPEYCWDMINDHKYGGITSICCYDICESGVPDIILGRADGVVEIFSLDENNQPRIQFTHSFGESISSVCGGRISSPNAAEVVVVTFSGCVYGLTRGHGTTTGTVSSEVKAKVETLRLEVSELESKLTVARKEYQSFVTEDGSTAVSALPEFAINDSFTLNQDEAWYTLTIETRVPLDFVAIQSNVPIDLQGVDKSSAVISYTDPDIKNGNYMLATCRCSDTNRLELKIRSIEGHSGTVQAYVTPKLRPKSTRLRQYHIKHLSLHQRSHGFDDSLPANIIEVSGNFTLANIHAWVNFCLPDVPDRPGSDVVTLQYKSYFTCTQLQCIYRKGHGKFVSDNISTISVMNEVISKEATKMKISVNISHVIDDQSIPHMVKLVHPRLESQLMLSKNVQLIDALRELQIHEGDTEFLAPQCQLILDNSEYMLEEIKRQPATIDRFYAVFTDIFMDRAAFKGINVKDKIPELMSLLDDCDLDTILAFFDTNL